MSSPARKLKETDVNQRCAPYQESSYPSVLSAGASVEPSSGGGGGGGTQAKTVHNCKQNNTATSSSSSQSRTMQHNSGILRNSFQNGINQQNSYFYPQTRPTYSTNPYGGMPMQPLSGGPSAYMPYTYSTMGATAWPQNTFGGNPVDPNNPSLALYAYESSQGVFEKAALAVSTMGSITHLLDCIFFSCSSSFHAIVGVVEQMSSLKSHFGRIMSAFAVVRSIRWLYARALRALGLRSQQEVEAAWREAVAATSGTSGAGRQRASWRRTAVVALLGALPALVYHLMQVLSAAADSTAGSGGGPLTIATTVDAGAAPGFYPTANITPGYINNGINSPYGYGTPFGYNSVAPSYLGTVYGSPYGVGYPGTTSGYGYNYGYGGIAGPAYSTVMNARHAAATAAGAGVPRPAQAQPPQSGNKTRPIPSSEARSDTGGGGASLG